MKKIAFYARYGKADQAMGYTQHDQEEAVRAYCAAHGLEIAGTYIDHGVSAVKHHEERPEMSRLLADVEAGRVDTIVFSSIDRWFRSADGYIKVQDILDRHGVTWHSARDGMTMAMATYGFHFAREYAQPEIRRRMEARKQ